jgi:hypothetical protein
MPEDSPAGRQRLERALEERRGMEEGEEFKPIWRGWCLGEEKFREELLTQMSERMGVEHYGPLAGGDDEDGGVDRRTSGDGHARISEPSLVSPEKAKPPLDSQKFARDLVHGPDSVGFNPAPLPRRSSGVRVPAMESAAYPSYSAEWRFRRNRPT